MEIPSYLRINNAMSPSPDEQSQENSSDLQGLGPLRTLDKMIVERTIDETSRGILKSPKRTFKYTVFDDDQRHALYRIIEERAEPTSDQPKMFYEGLRAKSFIVYDSQHKEVACLNVESSGRAWNCCCRTLLPQIRIYTGRNLLGSVHRSSASNWKFSVRNEAEEHVLEFLGGCSSVGDFRMKISSANNPRIGCIDRDWSPMMGSKPWNLDAVFEITFPVELDSKIKAVLLAGSILVDLFYYHQCKSHNPLEI